MSGFRHNGSKSSAQVLRSADEFRSMLGEWEELFRNSPGATPFQHPALLLSWIDAFTPRNLVGIEVRDGNRLVGFAALLIYPREQERVLAFAGGGVSDYLGLLAETGRELQVIEEVLHAAEAISAWDVLDLTDISGRSELLRFGAFKNCIREHDVCVVLALAETRDRLLHTFSQRQRANLRNARSRTQREGAATIELAHAHTLPEFMEDLFRLHALRWNEAGELGVLSDERVRQFHRAVAPDLLAGGILRLYRMRIDGQSVSAIYALFHQRTVYCYLQGFDPAFSHLSPGTQLMFAVIEDAVRLGMRRFDFLRGEEAYKMHWRPRGEPTYRIEVPRTSLRNQFRPAA